MEILASGFGLLESPRWHAGQLWFGDWTAGRILALDPSGSAGPGSTGGPALGRTAGSVREIVAHERLPLCFDFLPDGRLLIVSNREGALLVCGDGPPTRYAELADLSPWGCNDIVVDGRGNAYVNSVNFDFAVGPPPGAVQPGLIALVPPGGPARVVATDLAFPNGMAITPDGRTLVVADSYRHQLVGFAVAPDGGLHDRHVWADLGDHAPDGICADAEGAVWYADVPHRCCVRVARGGRVRDRVDLDRGGFACMLGGPEGTDLYVVAAHWPGTAGLAGFADWDGQVLRRSVAVPGAGWPAR